MVLHRNKLYVIISIACLAGYIWLFFGLTTTITENNSVGVCLIKNITNIPCTSCGSTRSVISIVKGNFKEALTTNPLGYVVALIMLISPIWIISDLLRNKKSLFNFYKKIELYLKKPQFAIPLILLVIVNWIWNITKEL